MALAEAEVLARPAARAESPWRKRVVMVLLAAALFSVAIPSGEWAQSHVRFAIDSAKQPCLPYRFYLIRVDDKHITRGAFASFKTRGLQPFFKDGTVFTKLVMGVPGDRVSIVGGYVEVAGRPVGGISPRIARALRRTPQSFDRIYTLGPGQYFMAGTEGPTPYDSRYYGPVVAEQLEGRAYPIW